MVDDLFSFVNWLNQVIKEKNITQADIAKTGFVTSSAVSLLFSMRIKSVGVDMCRAISAASGIPLETVYRRAGLLPPLTLSQDEQEQIAKLTAELDPDLRESALDYLNMLVSKQKNRSILNPKTHPKNA